VTDCNVRHKVLESVSSESQLGALLYILHSVPIVYINVTSSHHRFTPFVSSHLVTSRCTSNYINISPSLSFLNPPALHSLHTKTKPLPISCRTVKLASCYHHIITYSPTLSHVKEIAVLRFLKDIWSYYVYLKFLLESSHNKRGAYFHYSSHLTKLTNLNRVTL